MLHSYKYKNVLSFNQEAEFTMYAPATRVKSRFPNNYVEEKNGCNILKTAVIVGENAGGKTNFVKSLLYLRSFFADSDNVSAQKSKVNSNNLLEGCPKKDNTQQEFEIQVSGEEGKIYTYTLVIDWIGIVEERLCFRKNRTAKDILTFEMKRTSSRMECDLHDGECDKGKCAPETELAYHAVIPGISAEIKEALLDAVKNTDSVGLFAAKMALMGNRNCIEFMSIIKNSICPETCPLNYDFYLSVKEEKNYQDILKKKEYFEIFRMVDYSIYKVEVDDEKPFTDSIIYRKRKDGSSFARRLRADSSGVREFFAWAIQIYRVIYENKTVIADEMDRVLNPILSDRVISYINGKKHAGQFIFTSHNILHLDLKNYMKEQIYFVTKDVENLESELYSLADFPEVRYDTSKIYEFYMKGILGGTAIE
ncbi:MAG: ATP-binding protein [Lachnospiraceae bacterium]|nr:ATP-binding protein [Lachnospiraceae bacterium]